MSLFVSLFHSLLLILITCTLIPIEVCFANSSACFPFLQTLVILFCNFQLLFFAFTRREYYAATVAEW